MSDSTGETLAQVANEMLYGPPSVFTAAEQEAMRRGYTRAERLRISGTVYGGYPQAISAQHARKIRDLNRYLSERFQHSAYRCVAI